MELASLSDPDLVPQAVASSLGVSEQQGRPLTETLVEHLGPRRRLLVLDNCEHLVDACASLADALLRACPKVHILATSREALDIAGDRAWLVPSLSLPDPEQQSPVEELRSCEAIRLFVERARAVASGFELTEHNAAAVVRVCRVLERGDPARAAAVYEEDLRVLRRLRDKTGTAYGLRGMVCVASLRREPARAARLWGAAEALGEDIGLLLSHFDHSHPDYEGLLADARSRLDDDAAWEAARAEGRTMTPEEAIEYALGTEEPTPPTNNAPLLSTREVEVLVLVAEGLTDPQVAERLYLSPRTVGQHLRSIYRKLGVPSRAAAAREAVERRLI